MFYVLTHLCIASYKRVICKQCRPRSNAAERGFWSEFTLFAVTLESFNNKSKFYITFWLYNGPIQSSWWEWLYNGPIQSSWWESSLKILWHKWVKVTGHVDFFTSCDMLVVFNCKWISFQGKKSLSKLFTLCSKRSLLWKERVSFLSKQFIY